MDKVTEQLISYTKSFSEAELTEPVMEATVNHLGDSMACRDRRLGLEPGQILAGLATSVHSDRGATVFGYGFQTSPELAALANSMMIRTYDWNDGMLAPWGGHPSDMIPGLLAAGEVAHSSGMEILVAMALAYELLGGIGWDIQKPAQRHRFRSGHVHGRLYGPRGRQTLAFQ